jgi:hypothetical protein
MEDVCVSMVSAHIYFPADSHPIARELALPSVASSAFTRKKIYSLASSPPEEASNPGIL